MASFSSSGASPPVHGCVVVPAIWDDARFLSLPRDRDRLMFIHLLTCEGSLHIPGLIKYGIHGIADQMRIGVEAARESLQALVDAHLVEYNDTMRLVLIPKAPKYNLPFNPNMLVGLYRRWRAMPDCDLKSRYAAALHRALERSFTDKSKSRQKIASWKDAWERTFGQESFDRQMSSGQQDLLAKLVPFSGDLVGDLDGDLDGHLDSKVPPHEHVVEMSDQMSGQSGHKVKGNQPSTKKRGDTEGVTQTLFSEQFPPVIGSDLRSGSGSSSGRRSTSGSPRKAAHKKRGALGADVLAILERFRGACVAWWKEQEEMRLVIPGMRPIKGDDERLAPIALLLDEGYKDEEIRHVLLCYQQNAMRDPRGKTWFNGETNWIRKNFRRTLGQVADLGPKVTTGHVKLDGTEQYPPTGKVKV